MEVKGKEKVLTSTTTATSSTATATAILTLLAVALGWVVRRLLPIAALLLAAIAGLLTIASTLGLSVGRGLRAGTVTADFKETQRTKSSVHRPSYDTVPALYKC